MMSGSVCLDVCSGMMLQSGTGRMLSWRLDTVGLLKLLFTEEKDAGRVDNRAGARETGEPEDREGGNAVHPSSIHFTKHRLCRSINSHDVKS